MEYRRADGRKVAVDEGWRAGSEYEPAAINGLTASTFTEQMDAWLARRRLYCTSGAWAWDAWEAGNTPAEAGRGAIEERKIAVRRRAA